MSSEYKFLHETETVTSMGYNMKQIQCLKAFANDSERGSSHCTELRCAIPGNDFGGWHQQNEWLKSDVPEKGCNDDKAVTLTMKQRMEGKVE